MKPPGKPLLSSTALRRRVAVLGKEITAHYRGKPLTVIGLMNGSIFFLVDLVRQLPLETQVECWRVQSYQQRASSGKLRGLDHCDGNLKDRHVLIVDDILDTGLTLTAVQAHALKLGAKSVEICVLLNKRRPRKVKIKPRWAGFGIPDRFVVGYGLDDEGKFRGLNSIRALD